MNQKMGVLAVSIIWVLLIPLTGISFAEIYRYQDESGNWRFTDTPVDLPQNSEKMKHVIENDTIEINYDASENQFDPKNEVERAVLGTVRITSDAGMGTGFFISPKGYILTNKHVLRGSPMQIEQTEKVIDYVDEQLDRWEKGLRREEAYAAQIRTRIENRKRIVYGQGFSAVKKKNEQVIESDMKRLAEYEKSIRAKKKKIKALKRKLKQDARKFHSDVAISGLSRTFKVRLSDNSEKVAYLIAESKQHDLALLKIDHYKAHSLTPGDPLNLAQGDPVFAIGNPIGLSNSVAKGIFSGFENNHIKTDAKIYPGNSGGPLVNEDGRVVGINSYKKLTRKFEGLGFAIPIDIALEEFKHAIR